MTCLKISPSTGKPMTKPSSNPNSGSNIIAQQSQQPVSVKIEANSSSSHASHSAAANSAVNALNNCGSQSVAGTNTSNMSMDNKPVVAQRLLHNPGLATEWTAEEQAILDEGLVEWMTKKELGKRRKAEEVNLVKKEKSLEPVTKPSGTTGAKSSIPMYMAPSMSLDSDDGISNNAIVSEADQFKCFWNKGTTVLSGGAREFFLRLVIGGRAGELFEQNVQIISQIRANLAACKPQENTDLLVRFRDNILNILNGMTNVPGIMSQMPPLPVTLNTELADNILQKTLHHTSSLQP